MLDVRYPNLDHVHRAPPEARRAAAAVCRRTGLSAAWDMRTPRLYFYRNGDPQRGIFSIPFGPGQRCSDSDVDDAVRLIGTARMPAEFKTRRMAEAEAAIEREADEAVMKHCEDRRKPAEDYLKHRRNIRGMHSTYRPSAVVNGLKGT